MKWILGIDGGGTRAVACAGNLAGNLLGRLEAGPANYHLTGIEKFQLLVNEVVDRLCRDYCLKRDNLQIISLGLAGVDRERDRQLVVAAIKSAGIECLLVVNNDAAVALAAGLGKTEGIALIAGTGSIAYGINGEGCAVRAGGWGHIISDEGSGYDIGRQALVRSVKAWEGRDKASVLMEKIMKVFKIADMDGMIGYIYHPGTDKTAIAALTEVVAEAADQGDAVALEIIDAAADALAGLVKSVISRGFPGGELVRVCASGGVIGNIPRIRQALAEKLAGKALLVFSDREPALGALALGYEYLRNLKE